MLINIIIFEKHDPSPVQHFFQKSTSYWTPAQSTKTKMTANGFSSYELFVKKCYFCWIFNRSGNFSWKNTFSFPGFEKLLIEDFVFWPQKQADLLISRNHWGGGPLSGSSRCCQICRLFLWIILLGWGTTFWELKVLSRCRFFLWIGTLSVDFPLWTARAGMCPTGRVSF